MLTATAAVSTVTQEAAHAGNPMSGGTGQNRKGDDHGDKRNNNGKRKRSESPPRTPRNLRGEGIQDQTNRLVESFLADGGERVDNLQVIAQRMANPANPGTSWMGRIWATELRGGQVVRREFSLFREFRDGQGVPRGTILVDDGLSPGVSYGTMDPTSGTFSMPGALNTNRLENLHFVQGFLDQQGRPSWENQHRR
jgi:hypothetical protein